MTAPMSNDPTDMPDPTDLPDLFFKSTFPWFTQTRRAYFYRVCLGLSVCLGLVGVVSSETVWSMLGVAGLLLGTGTATAYTPRTLRTPRLNTRSHPF